MAPNTVTALVLVDPALPAGRSTDRTVAGEFLLNITPGVGEARLRYMHRRLAPEAQVARVIDLCFVDPSSADPRMLAAMTELVRTRSAEVSDIDVSFLAATRSLMALLARRRAYQATMASVDRPVLLINGTEDRLVPIASARRAAARNPRWSTEFLAGVGHTPQLEVPERFFDVVTGWLGGL
ncbi:MAG TPA: alpha/beta fold hydrolase [Aldersonia sp.]